MSTVPSSLNSPPDAEQSEQEPEARERIRRAAQRQFAEIGYEGVSVRQIAEAAGVTKPMVYYYFGSKEGLFAHLVESAFEKLRERLERAAETCGSARERLLAVAKANLALVEDDLETLRFLAAHAFAPRQAAPATNPCRYRQIQAEIVSRILDQGVKAGELPALDLFLAADTFGAALGVFFHSFHSGPAPEPDLPARVVDMLWHGLARGGCGSR